jgi:hypothetical protein
MGTKLQKAADELFDAILELAGYAAEVRPAICESEVGTKIRTGLAETFKDSSAKKCDYVRASVQSVHFGANENGWVTKAMEQPSEFMTESLETPSDDEIGDEVNEGESMETEEEFADVN